MGDRALAVTEIASAAGFYDYEAKYADGGSRHTVPAAVHPETYARAMDVALAAHRALGCRGATRADLRYDDTAGEPGRLVLLEVNTQPGLTPTSLLPEQAGASRHRLPRALRLDGGARRMSRVTTSDRATNGRSANGAAGARPSARTPAKPPRPLNDRPSRWKLLRRRQRYLLRPVAWGLAGVLVLAAAAAAVRAVQPGGSIASLRARISAGASLPVQHIVIEGRSLTPEGTLRTALSVSKGDKLLGFSLEAARARIERLTWVQHATVERRLPGTIVVQLTERRPFAVWQSRDKFVLIDRAGQGRRRAGPGEGRDRLCHAAAGRRARRAGVRRRLAGPACRPARPAQPCGGGDPGRGSAGGISGSTTARTCCCPRAPRPWR